MGTFEIDEYKYQRVNKLGNGSYGDVYRGIHKTTNYNVAIKKVDIRYIGPEIRAIKELSQLKHENLVTVLKCVQKDPDYYVIMEFCDYGDFGTYLREKRKLPWTDLPRFLFQLANGLSAMHQQNIIHRDLKPQNILLCNPRKIANPSLSDLVVKLADFGISRQLPSGQMANTFMGTIFYMAPELFARKPYTQKADLWSLGLITCKCLFEDVPFLSEISGEIEFQSFYAQDGEVDLSLVLLSNFSADLNDLLRRLLKKNPDDRIGSSELLQHPFISKDQSSLVPSAFFIKILTLGGSKFTISGINSETSIDVLREKVAKKTGVIVQVQVLLFNGRMMESGKSLKDYNVNWGDTIYLVHRQKGGF